MYNTATSNILPNTAIPNFLNGHYNFLNLWHKKYPHYLVLTCKNVLAFSGTSR